MKISYWINILFIVLTTATLICINEYGNTEILGKYSFLIALISFFVGKAVRNYEIKEKQS